VGNQSTSVPYIVPPTMENPLSSQMDLPEANKELEKLTEMTGNPSMSYEEAEEKVQNDMILDELRELNRQDQNPLLGGPPPTIIVL
jgi:hypothetical protein